MSVLPRVYDYRIREQIVRTGNLDLFPELEISRGTALTWLRRGMPDVVWLDDVDADRAGLRERIVRLEKQVRMRTVLLRLTLTVRRDATLGLRRSDARRNVLRHEQPGGGGTQGEARRGAAASDRGEPAERLRIVP